jgi:hypothetical protein
LAAQGQNRLIFWGQGELAEIAYISLQEIPELEFVALVENDANGGTLFGRKILAPGELGEVGFDLILITAVSSLDEIRSMLSELAIPRQKILFL